MCYSWRNISLKQLVFVVIKENFMDNFSLMIIGNNEFNCNEREFCFLSWRCKIWNCKKECGLTLHELCKCCLLSFTHSQDYICYFVSVYKVLSTNSEYLNSTDKLDLIQTFGSSLYKQCLLWTCVQIADKEINLKELGESKYKGWITIIQFS